MTATCEVYDKNGSLHALIEQPRGAAAMSNHVEGVLLFGGHASGTPVGIVLLHPIGNDNSMLLHILENRKGIEPEIVSVTHLPILQSLRRVFALNSIRGKDVFIQEQRNSQTFGEAFSHTKDARAKGQDLVGIKTAGDLDGIIQALGALRGAGLITENTLYAASAVAGKITAESVVEPKSLKRSINSLLAFRSGPPSEPSHS